MMWRQTSEAGRESREFGARPEPTVTGCGNLRGAALSAGTQTWLWRKGNWAQ